MSRVTKAVLLSMGVSLVLVALQYSLSVLSGSAALAADTLHSATDLVVSTLVLISVRLAKTGHKTWSKVLDTVLGLSISGLILAVAYTFAVARIGQSDYEIRYPLPTLAGIFITIVLLNAISNYKTKVGREEGSQALVADGFHSRMDMVTSVAVFIGVFGHWRGLKLDPIAGFAMAVVVGILGLELLVETVGALFRDGGLLQSRQSIHRFFEKTLPFLFGHQDETSGLAPWMSKRALAVTGLIILAIVVITSLHAVAPGHTGLVFRFGALTETNLAPGLYLRPWPVYEMVKLDTRGIRTVQVGFRIDAGGETTNLQWESSHAERFTTPVPAESFTLTGDNNLVDISWIISYRVKDARSFLLNVDNPEIMIRAAGETALRDAAARTDIDTLLTTGRLVLNTSLREAIQHHLDQWDTGLDLVSVHVLDVHPPKAVVESFREVFSAQEDMQTAINNAQATANDQLPKARGKASTITEEAQARAVERLAKARSEKLRMAPQQHMFKRFAPLVTFKLRMEHAEKSLKKKNLFVVDHRLKGVWFASPDSPVAQ